MRLLITSILIFSSTFFYSQSFEVGSFFGESSKNGKIEGFVLDNEENNEPLAFATISVKNTGVEVSSNIDGSFSINLKPGKYTLVYQFIGYKTVEIENVTVVSNSETISNQSLNALTIDADISLVSLN